MTRIDKAVERFRTGCSCSQAILTTYGPLFGVSERAALQVASGFGGGIGRLGFECGAVTGAVMVLGLRYGPSSTDDTAAREKVYELVREFAKRFRQRCGSLLCRELIGCDISTAEGLQQARRNDVFRTVCPNFVRHAAQILEELFDENQ